MTENCKINEDMEKVGREISPPFILIQISVISLIWQQIQDRRKIISSRNTSVT